MTVVSGFSLADIEAEVESLEARVARLHLRDFIEPAWKIVETAPFVGNWHIEKLCDALEAVTRGEIKHLIINIPPGTMKALDVETPVLTTWGWRRHGDLRSGDYVFGPDGTPRRILAVTAHAIEAAYALSFDDGATIVAGAGHLWEVERDLGETPRARRRFIVETPELRDGQRPDAIRVAEPVALPPKRLLIDPYLLGAWLGDGASSGGSIYASAQDVGHMMTLGHVAHVQKAAGPYRQDFFRILVPGLQARLRALGLLGNKHVPEDYLEASIEQRYSMLQGLMDTDGTCSESGSCSFTSASLALALAAQRLVTSLGMKAYRRSRMTTLNGKVYGPHYRVTFTSRGDVPIFRLKRKQDRVVATTSDRKRRRYLRARTSAGTRSVNCIQVEGGVYLAGHDLIPTHNSLLVSVIWPAWEWATDPGLKYLTASYGSHLSIRDNLRVREIVQSEWYKKHFTLRLTGDQNAKALFNTNAKGWRFATSVGGGGVGEHPDRIIIDDPHTPKQARSDVEREAAINWFDRTISTRGVARDARIVVIMQRLHEEDLSGHLLALGGWDHIMLPMRFEEARRDKLDDRKKDGDLLWPKVFSEERVRSLEILLDPYGAAGQLQQRPAPEGGGLFKRQWIEIVDVLPPGPVIRCRGWDTGGTEGGGDFTAGVKIAKIGTTFVVEDVVKGQWSPANVDAIFLQTAQIDGPACRQREEQEPGASGKSVIASRVKLLVGFDCKGVSATGDKITRARPFRAQCEAGNVKLKRGDWNAAYLDELCSFPVAGHDDQVDASSCAFNELALKIVGGIRKTTIG